MVDRHLYLQQLNTAVRRSPVTALLGPRQCGKTTLARVFAQSHETTYFDLESFPDRQRLENPELVLGDLHGIAVLDEIQEMPQLFSVLRVLVDRPDCRVRFLVLGSASPHIVKGASETLAGRIEFVELSGFDLQETRADHADQLWLRGGFPRSFLAPTDDDSMAWREGFVRTFLERDIPQLGISIPAAAMRRFWTMLAHYHGQTWNASELARSMGLTDKTVRSYLDILTGTFMVRQLQPWYANIGKRQVKAPKVYLRDSGLLHTLLGIPDRHSLLGHPRLGASWEGFALEQTLRVLRPTGAYFWAAHSGAELDLFIPHRGHRFGIDFKFSEAPKVPKSLHAAMESLRLDHLWLVYPGVHEYRVQEHITVIPLMHLGELPTRWDQKAAPPPE
jgi:hypothetical protein